MKPREALPWCPARHLRPQGRHRNRRVTPPLQASLLRSLGRGDDRLDDSIHSHRIPHHAISRSTQGIDLIDEKNARCTFSRLIKHVFEPFYRRLSFFGIDEKGRRLYHHRHLRLSCHGLHQECLSGARWANQKDSLWNLFSTTRASKKPHHFTQGWQGRVDARQVTKPSSHLWNDSKVIWILSKT